MHEWHAAHGARFVNAGLWKRPHSYPRAGESEDDAANREARNVRTHVGVVDVSTLGKIELQGRDVAEFLNRIYINKWDTLAVGRCRYGVMLRDDGIVMDDGTTSRLAADALPDDHHDGERGQGDAADRVPAAGAMARARGVRDLGDRAMGGSRDLRSAARATSWRPSSTSTCRMPRFRFSPSAIAMFAPATRSIPARLFRMSYSGELAYEIHVPADRGRALWDAVLAAGEAFGLMPYGTEAMSTLRIEKGHVVIGPEADGRTTADDLGMGKLVSAAKWCIGKPLLERPALTDPNRWQLVGLTALDGGAMPRAAKIVADPDHATPNPMLGHVTSWCFSPNLEAWIALALVARGRERHGETLWAVSPLADAQVRVRVGPPCFIDPQGERLRV